MPGLPMIDGLADANRSIEPLLSVFRGYFKSDQSPDVNFYPVIDSGAISVICETKSIFDQDIIKCKKTTAN